MRNVRTVLCSVVVLVMVGIGSAVGSADAIPNATSQAWSEPRKLCLQMPGSSMCEAMIDALSGEGNPISLPSSGDTLTDAIDEALVETGARALIIANDRDRDGASYKAAYLSCVSPHSKVERHVCDGKMAKINARIKARAKATIGDKQRFRHCKEISAPVDDPEEIVKCLEDLAAIVAACGPKKPCVTDNFSAYSALLVYTVKPDNKARDGAFVSRCQEQYENLRGLGYREVWACVQNYLGLPDKVPERTDGN